MKVKSERQAAQSCPTLSDPMDCSVPGSSIHGIFQARVLEWGAIAFSKSISKSTYSQKKKKKKPANSHPIWSWGSGVRDRKWENQVGNKQVTIVLGMTRKCPRFCRGHDTGLG